MDCRAECASEAGPPEPGGRYSADPRLIPHGLEFWRQNHAFEPAASVAADDCQPCLPGDPVRLEGILSGSSLTGTVTFRGQTYGLGGSGNFDAGAHLLFTGEGLVMPSFTADGTVALEAPFGLTGVLSIPGSPPAGVATQYALSGQGLASLTFEERFAAPEVPVWFIRSVVFSFSH